jgi:hypothetical protein
MAASANSGERAAEVIPDGHEHAVTNAFSGPVRRIQRGVVVAAPGDEHLALCGCRGEETPTGLDGAR